MHVASTETVTVSVLANILQSGLYKKYLNRYQAFMIMINTF